MSSPYRHAVGVLRERREEVARSLGETEVVLAKLSTERMRLRIELDALEQRLALVQRPSLDASASRPPLHRHAFSHRVLAAAAVCVTSTEGYWTDGRVSEPYEGPSSELVVVVEAPREPPPAD